MTKGMEMAQNKQLAYLARMVEEFASDFQISRTRKGHLAVEIKHGDQTKTIFAPGTTSDHRAMLNVRTKIKHAANELKARAA
jgi:hypothetical protein